MAHQPLDKVVSPAAAYVVEVKIRDYSQSGLKPGSLVLSWRLKGHEGWQNIPLRQTTEEAPLFSAFIPGNQAGKTMEYFLSAEDLSGRHESLPKNAPNFFYSFSVPPEH
jgi:hypothetical protein